MNILIIPSWYPNTKNSTVGIFCQEQVSALAKLAPKHNFIIAYWGQEFTQWNFKNPISFAKAIQSYFKIRKGIYLENQYHIASFPIIFPNFRLGGFFLIKKRIEKILKKVEKKFGRVDLIHSHVFYPGGLLASYLYKKYGINFITTEHMSPFPFLHLSKQKKINDLIEDIFKSSKKNICVSQAQKEQIENYSNSNLQVVYNLVDTDYFKPISAFKKNDQISFLFVGGLSYQKGLDYLIKAIENITLPITIRIGGHGPEESKLKNLAKSCNVEDKVLFLGPLSKNEVLKEIQNCDAFILPSRFESFGIVLAEAMSCGKPVLATRCGGPEEIVTEDVGILVEKESVQALSLGIENISKKIQNSYYDSGQIRNYAIKNFSARNIVEKILKIYEEVVQ